MFLFASCLLEIKYTSIWEMLIWKKYVSTYVRITRYMYAPWVYLGGGGVDGGFGLLFFIIVHVYGN